MAEIKMDSEFIPKLTVLAWNDEAHTKLKYDEEYIPHGGEIIKEYAYVDMTKV